jgi:hypothetical protein
VSPTLIAIPLLFSGFLYPLGLQRLWPHSRRFLLATTLVAAGAILATLIPQSTLTVIACAIAVLALTILLFDAIAALGREMLLPCVLAVLLAITLRTLNNTAALGLTHRGVALLILVVITAVALQVVARKAPVVPAQSFQGAATVIAFLLAEYQLLGQPAALATLHEVGSVDPAWWYFALLVSSQIGLLAGLRASATMHMHRRRVIAAAVAYLASVALLVSGLAYIAAPVWTIIAQVSAVFLLGAALSRPALRVGRAGTRTGLTQVVWWLLIVMHAFAAKWPFLPSALHPMLQNRATIYLLLSFAVLPVAAFLDSGRRNE